MPFLTRLFRRLRGLGTCPDCGGPTIRDRCPLCLEMFAVTRAAKIIREVRADNKALGADNEILRCENRILSERLMVYEIIAKAKHDESS